MEDDKTPKKYENKEMYLMGSNTDESKILIDGRSTKKLADVHKRKLIDTVFVDSTTYRELLVDYCATNQIGEIDVEETNTSNPTEMFLHVLSYTQKNPDKRVMALVCPEGDLEKLVGYFKKIEWPAERA